MDNKPILNTTESNVKREQFSFMMGLTLGAGFGIGFMSFLVNVYSYDKSTFLVPGIIIFIALISVSIFYGILKSKLK